MHDSRDNNTDQIHFADKVAIIRHSGCAKLQQQSRCTVQDRCQKLQQALQNQVPAYFWA